ncbi:MAG: M15 family metallopeptidase [Bryobacterales bacterium]|nr:M15 family metallopeptidase [Bryobacterales bacterium]
MRVLRLGSSGAPVRRWQLFLIGQGFDLGAADGKFGARTEAATRAFQARHHLDVDGVVGNQCYGQAMLLGFDATRDDDQSPNGPNYPPPPAFDPLITNAERQAVFGRYEFEAAPLPHDPDAVRVVGDWEQQNIVWVNIPQLAGYKNAKRNGDIQFHQLAAAQLVKLWKAWDDAGLLGKVLSFDGSYVPRFVRGSRTVLSNHAFGSAFDINSKWNKLAAVPALAGERGSVRDLVALANQHGFYWGGHFRGRLDGMHFEVAKLIP